MKNHRIIFYIVLLLAGFSVSAWAALPQYSVKRATAAIMPDGILDEEDWKVAPAFGDFVFPWYTSGEKEQTEAKMLWDDDFLYLSFVCRDLHIWADHYNTNSSVSTDDAAEIFWNPSPDTQGNYYQFEMNCIGNVLSVYHNGASVRPVILVPHIGRVIDGSVNKDSDADTLWVLEVAIRFTDYPEIPRSHLVPQAGDMWRINLNRCGGKTNLQYSQWSPSPTAQPQFHSPDDFGQIYFLADPGRTGTRAPEAQSALPAPLEIRGNHPNPFNPSTTIDFSIPGTARVQLDIYDIASRRVRTLLDHTLAPGAHSALWDGCDDRGRPVSSGTYFARLRAGQQEVSWKMLLIK
jgi:hypothetical protein